MPSHIVVAAVVGLAVFAALVVVPMPWYGLNYYNVDVSTTLGETCFIFCSYSVQSVNPSVAGPATLIDIPGWLGIQGIAPPCINCQYKVTISLSNGQSTAITESKFISNLINIGYTDTVSGMILYVPAGTYLVTVVLALNGVVVTNPGTATITVPG